jgi:hypothetical protein
MSHNIKNRSCWKNQNPYFLNLEQTSVVPMINYFYHIYNDCNDDDENMKSKKRLVEQYNLLTLSNEFRKVVRQQEREERRAERAEEELWQLQKKQEEEERQRKQKEEKEREEREQQEKERQEAEKKRLDNPLALFEETQRQLCEKTLFISLFQFGLDQELDSVEDCFRVISARLKLEQTTTTTEKESKYETATTSFLLDLNVETDSRVTFVYSFSGLRYKSQSSFRPTVSLLSYVQLLKKERASVEEVFKQLEKCVKEKWTSWSEYNKYYQEIQPKQQAMSQRRQELVTLIQSLDKTFVYDKQQHDTSTLEQLLRNLGMHKLKASIQQLSGQPAPDGRSMEELQQTLDQLEQERALILQQLTPLQQKLVTHDMSNSQCQKFLFQRKHEALYFALRRRYQTLHEKYSIGKDQVTERKEQQKIPETPVEWQAFCLSICSSILDLQKRAHQNLLYTTVLPISCKSGNRCHWNVLARSCCCGSTQLEWKTHFVTDAEWMAFDGEKLLGAPFSVSSSSSSSSSFLPSSSSSSSSSSSFLPSSSSSSFLPSSSSSSSSSDDSMEFLLLV